MTDPFPYAAIEMHRAMGGPGLVEDVYEEALEEVDIFNPMPP